MKTCGVLLAVATLGLATPALGESIDGWGRAGVLVGGRWVPNWYFAARAAQAGAPYTEHLGLGPAFTASFGYGALSWLELAIDLHAEMEWFALETHPQAFSVSYGALIGARVTQRNVFSTPLTPYLGLEVGPLLSDLIVDGALTEMLLATFAVTAGVHWAIGGHWSLVLDVRYLPARNMFVGISGINVGGVTVSLGLEYLFAPTPSRDLDVPGFGSGSHLPD